MNKQQQEQFFDEFTSKMKKVMLGKGDDYALDKDRLSNFKNVGTICGSGEDGRLACLHLIATKVARLTSLLGENKAPSNESIDDSILDLSNYSVLLAMLQKDAPIVNLTRESRVYLGNQLVMAQELSNPESSDV